MNFVTETLLQVALVLSIVLILKNLFWKSKTKEEQEDVQDIDDVQRIYNSLNHAIKTGQPTLRITVDHISSVLFMAIWRGFEKHYPELSVSLKTDLSRGFQNHSEYLLFDLSKYQGPKDRNLEVKLVHEPLPEFPSLAPPPPNVISGPFGGQRRSNRQMPTSFGPSFFEENFAHHPAFMRRNPKPKGKPVVQEMGKVISMEDYRRKKQS